MLYISFRLILLKNSINFTENLTVKDKFAEFKSY